MISSLLNIDESTASSETTSEDTNLNSTEEAASAIPQVPLTIEQPSTEEHESQWDDVSLMGTSVGKGPLRGPDAENYAHRSRVRLYNFLDIPRQTAAPKTVAILSTENIRDALHCGFSQLHSDITSLRHSTQAGWEQVAEQVAAFTSLLNQLTKPQSPCCTQLQAASSQAFAVSVNQAIDSSSTELGFVTNVSENDCAETLGNGMCS